MRRYSSLKPSRGTVWPPEVRAHVRWHYAGCIGPLAGMPGDCSGEVELDHIRASHGVGMKSASVATNAAPLCPVHHSLKTRRGREWRPRLLTVWRRLTAGCASCEAEWAEWYPEVVA